jgi:hypothetical protein
MISIGVINACITYNPVIDIGNACVECITSVSYDNIRVGLIKRIGEDIDTSLWTSNNKALIAT